MSTRYRIKDFAARAGVTVKALHHYDRLGLLKAARSSSGYRSYCDRDLQRLEEIAALKLIGIPLKQIAALLKGDTRSLGEVLESQRRVLHARRRVIDQAIDAIEVAQRTRQSAAVGDSEVLRTLIEAMEMQNDVDVLKVYFDDDAWVRWRAGHARWPGPEWHTLLREVEEARVVDPKSDRAVGLAERWNALVEADIGKDSGARRAFTKAWRSWAMKPETRPALLGAYDLDRIFRFIVNATGAMAQRRLAAAPDVARVKPRASPVRVQLFHDARALLGTSPESTAARDLARRLQDLLREEIGDDEDLLAEMQAMWQRRHGWPEAAVEWVASTYDMDARTFLAVADFLAAARVSSGRD